MRTRIISETKHSISGLYSDSEMLYDLNLPFTPKIGEFLEFYEQDAPHGYRISEIYYTLENPPDGSWICTLVVSEM